MDPSGRERLYSLLQVVAHGVKVRADRESLASGGVTAAQAAVMFVIARERETTQRHIAEQLRLNESAVTGMVSRLIGAGYVNRSPSATDRRAWNVALTPAGQTALGGFRESLDRLNGDLTRALGGEAAVAGFAGNLRAIMAMLDGGDPDV